MTAKSLAAKSYAELVVFPTAATVGEIEQCFASVKEAAFAKFEGAADAATIAAEEMAAAAADCVVEEW